MAPIGPFNERETEILVEDKNAENTGKSATVQTSFPGVPQGKESLKTRVKDPVSARFENVLRYCVLYCCFVIYLRLSMYNKKNH